MTRAIVIALIPILTLAKGVDLRMIPHMGDARTSRIGAVEDMPYIRWNVDLPTGVHSGMTITAWVRISKVGRAELTTEFTWCPEAIDYTRPDILQGAARDVDLTAAGGTLTFTGVNLPPYDAPETHVYWANGVCTIAGESEQPITVIIGGNEIQLGAGEFNKNMIPGGTGNIVIAGGGMVNLGISQTPCYQFYHEIDGVIQTQGVGVAAESTVTNEFAMCTWRLKCTDDDRQIYRSDIGRLHAFDALAVTKTNGACAGYDSRGYYRVGFVGTISDPPYDIQVFDQRVFGRWLTDTELERIHANGVQEIYRRGEDGAK